MTAPDAGGGEWGPTSPSRLLRPSAYNRPEPSNTAVNGAYADGRGLGPSSNDHLPSSHTVDDCEIGTNQRFPGIKPN